MRITVRDLLPSMHVWFISVWISINISWFLGPKFFSYSKSWDSYTSPTRHLFQFQNHTESWLGCWHVGSGWVQPRELVNPARLEFLGMSFTGILNQAVSFLLIQNKKYSWKIVSKRVNQIRIRLYPDNSLIFWSILFLLQLFKFYSVST